LPENVRPVGIASAAELLLFLQAADVALNPMMHGSGTNIKMLDTMAAALPILTTATGARGLEGRSGEHWIEAERDDFPHALRELVGNPALATNLAGNARRLAENVYDWPIIAARYAQTLRSLLTSGARKAEARR
jgi:glycosyltransferase involved in cell wall biosynthesis